MFKYLYLLSIIFASAISIATVPVDGVVALCKPYPVIKDLTSYPTKFNSTNNLARPKDSGFYEAEGEKITIYGRVMDSNCVPINDVKIYIWQANKVGYAQHELKNPKPNDHPHKWIDPNFTGTGTTNTDNLGRFNFTTIKPGSLTHVTPHIHLMIMHPKLETLYTKIYFPANEHTSIIDTTELDKVFKITEKDIIAQVSVVPGVEPHTYLIDITMDQEIKEKGY